MALSSKLSRAQAINEVGRIINNQDSAYHLVPFSQFRNGKRIRSSRYNSFLVLCYANTNKDAGWLLCKFAVTGGCLPHNGLLVFNTATGGTGRLERHMSQHTSVKADIQTLPKAMPQISKRNIARSAAMAVVLDLRPVSFTDNHDGLTHLASSLFKAGQATPFGEQIEPKSLLPCAKTVSLALSTMVQENRSSFKKLLPELIKIGGGVTTDGVTLKVQDKQFYDLTLHYIDYHSTSSFESTTTFTMRCKTLLLQEKVDNGSAEQIRHMLGSALSEKYGCDIDALCTGFTMVTDNASLMARVANSSVSMRVAPSDEKWLGCLVHQLNTAMKCCLGALANQDEASNIFNDVQAVKKIVRIFKQSNWNSLLPEGYKLIPEVETRFGTTFLVVQRFLKSSSQVGDILQQKTSAPATVAFESLCRSTLPSGANSFPALEALLDAFKDVISLQTEWEASQKPTIQSALAKFQICTDKLQAVVDGGSVWRGENNGFIPAPRLSRVMCRATVEWLESKIRIHPLIVAACYMNPLFREFQFITNLNKRRAYRSTGETMVRRLLTRYTEHDASHAGTEDPNQEDLPSAPTQGETQILTVGQKRTFSLLEYADSHFPSAIGNDEIGRYNNMDISRLDIDRPTYMMDPFSTVRFWHMHRATFPKFFKVALRLYAVPVSSCASERVFSAVNRIVTRDRARMSSKTLEDIVVTRSLIR